MPTLRVNDTEPMAAGVSAVNGVKFNTPYIFQILIISSCLVVVVVVALLLLLKSYSRQKRMWKDAEDAKGDLETSSAPMSRHSSCVDTRRLYGSTENLTLPVLQLQSEQNKTHRKTEVILEFTTKMDFIGRYIYIQRIRVTVDGDSETKGSKRNTKMVPKSQSLFLDIASATLSDQGQRHHRVQLDLVTKTKGKKIHISKETIGFKLGKKFKIYEKLLELSVHEVTTSRQANNEEKEMNEIRKLGYTTLNVDDVTEVEAKFKRVMEENDASPTHNHAARIWAKLTFIPGSEQSAMLVNLIDIYSINTHCCADNAEQHQVFVNITNSAKGEFLGNVMLSSSLQTAFVNNYAIDETVKILTDNRKLEHQRLTFEVLLAHGNQAAETIGLVHLGNFAAASGSGLQQWKLAMENPNNCIEMSHVLRKSDR